MGLPDNGRFIQVVFLGKFKILDHDRCMHCEEFGARLIISGKNAIVGKFIASK